MENKNGISDNQKRIISLYNEGLSFSDIAEKMGISSKLIQVNYYYALQKMNAEIPNKNSELSEKQKQDIKQALEALSNHLRELKTLDAMPIDELSYNPNDLINICQEMADKVGVPFDLKEFI